MRCIWLSGEFNSGKSSLINALVGQRIVEEGVTPTTSQVCLIGGAGSTRTGPAGIGDDAEVCTP